MTDDSTTKPAPSTSTDTRSPSTDGRGTGTPPPSTLGDPVRRPFGDMTDDKNAETDDAGEGHKGPAGETPKGTPASRPSSYRSNIAPPQSPRAV
jgi:hypothetical protein